MVSMFITGKKSTHLLLGEEQSRGRPHLVVQELQHQPLHVVDVGRTLVLLLLNQELLEHLGCHPPENM